MYTLKHPWYIQAMAMIRWICQQDIATTTVGRMADATYPLHAPHFIGETRCGGRLIQEGEGMLAESDDDWPDCNLCGKTMLPFEEVRSE